MYFDVSPILKTFQLKRLNLGKVKKWMAVILHIFYEYVTFFI